MLSGSPATGNRNSRGTESVVEVIERLEPTIGLEPMTCRLRTEEDPEPSATQPTSDDVAWPVFDASSKGDDPARSS